MGATQSHEPQPVVETVDQEGGGTKLFKFIKGETVAAGGSWDLYSANASYNFYDVNEDGASGKPKWYLEAGSEVEAEVSDNFSFEEQSRRVTFVANGIWALKFATLADYRAFSSEYNDKLFQNTYGLENDQAGRDKVFGKDSLLNLGGETEDSRNQWLADMDVDEKPDAEELRRGKQVSENPEKEVVGLRLGAGDRSYLMRDGQIDVLRNVYGGVQDTGINFTLTPSKGTSNFTPSKQLLMRSERRMNLLSPDSGHKMLHADIETGKVVSEWQFQKDGVDVAMKDLINETRAAQLDDRSTFLGLGSNRLVRWDMRTEQGIVSGLESPSVVNWAGGKDYATKTNFNCMATSGDGYVVIGSEDGQIRLYSEKSLTRANTAIPGLGAPITAVDVTFDGNWVLATTKSYLMVVKTIYRDKNDKETNAFKSRAGARAPAPRLLRLKPEDTAMTGGAPLTKGKFTWVTQAGRQERWIVASCGNYTVLWNFRQVKLANPDVVSYGGLTTVTNYHLIPKSESVVDSVFMHDNYAASPSANDSSMVVVTKHAIWSLGDDE
ncbi:hypothetical protein WJX72_009697 [[Myrmecia] bisecta]|uniref:Vacuolar import/degradation Vid27 C-terminal domain-containing protein n=1 Tax=[Myrmecia] bisecta TaxID=41462 RepID=A0AAW1Q850_9CHLO